MIRRLAAFLSLVVLALAVAACGSSTTGNSEPSYSPQEQAALDALHGKCRVDGDGGDDKLYAEAQETNTLLRKDGVTDETTLTVLQHLRQSIPDGAPELQCSELLADYEQLRAHGNSGNDAPTTEEASPTTTEDAPDTGQDGAAETTTTDLPETTDGQDVTAPTAGGDCGGDVPPTTDAAGNTLVCANWHWVQQ